MTDIKRIFPKEGICVYGYHSDRFKSENISVYLSVPNDRKDSVKRSLLLSVLKRGTKLYPTQKDINIRLDELYATLLNLKNQKFESCQLLGICADVINSAYTDGGEDLLDSALGIIDQILFSPILDGNGGFLEDYVKSEKDNYKSIVNSQINEPRTFAAIRCREEMFDSLEIQDRLGVLCEKIENTTRDEIMKCYLEVLKTAQITVFYVGCRSVEEIAKKVCENISFEPCANTQKKDHSIKLLTDREEPKVFVEDMEVSQGRLVIGFNCGVTWRDEDYYAMLLCNEIFGASPISKLMMGVREELSLCYECSSVYNSARGALFATTGIDSCNYELAKAAILDQLDAIKNGRISEVEFEAAKKSIFNVYNAIYDSPSAIERFYLGRLINGIDVCIKEFLEKMEALTVADVVKAAGKLKLHTVFFLRGSDEEREGDSCE